MALKQGTAYKWDKEAEFKLSSDQFGTLYNTLNAIVSSDLFKKKLEEAHQVIAITSLHSLFNDVLSNAIDAGVAKEVEPATEEVAHIMD